MLFRSHMNKFPQAKYHGLQVYYSCHDQASRTLADGIQESVRESLQADNDRETKPATSALYLMHKILSPAVLIECGFLSNEEEARQLADPTYRATLCLSLATAYGKWEARR